AKLPFNEKKWLTDAGQSGSLHGEPGFSTLERIWAGPTAEINGMWGGHTGPGSKTIIPRAAHAKISFRLVADQDPADVAAAFREYVAAWTPDGLTAEITVLPAVRPCHSPIDSVAVQAGRRAMERAFGREVLFTKEGGSGPEADLAEILDAPLVFIAVGLDPVRIDDGERGEAALVFVPPDQAPEGTRFLLGQEADGVVYFGVSGPLPALPDGVRRAALREVGTLLGDRDAGLLTHAVALANWNDTHTHCPVDGTPTVPGPGGHFTVCPADGTEHFPRTDPAVIMLVTDPDDRCLLARNAA